MSPSSLTEVLRETLALFDDSDAPLTTAEVADRLDLGRRSTYERLERLVDHDRIETKKVGANGRVWWRPTTGTAGRFAGPADGPASGDFRTADDVDEFGSSGEAGVRSANAILDSAGHIRAWPANAEALTGWSEAEILEKPFATLHADRSADDGGLERLLETARVDGYVETQRVYERPSGATFPASTTITPHRTDDGDVSGYTVVLRDETDRRRVEAERRLLADVSRSVAAAESFADGVESALAAVATHTEWAYGEAWAPVEDGEHLEYVAGHAEDAALAPFLNASESVTFPFGEGLPGRVYASGTPEWIPNASEASETTFRRPDLTSDVGLRAALGVPITADDRVLAVLTFFLRDHRNADDRLVNVVSDVAAELGGLIARKRMEDALAAERALLDRIFTTSPVGTLVTDADGIIRRANRYATELFGGANEGLVGGAVADIDVGFRTPDGEEVPSTQLPVARTLERGEPIDNVELKLVRDGGETGWISMSTAPIRTADDAVNRVTVVVEDITERRKRENDARETARQLQGVLDTVEAAIFLKDPDGRYLLLNRNCRDILGIEEHEVAVGKTDDDLFPEAVAAQYRADDTRVLEAAETVEVEESVPTVDGTRMHLTRKSPIFDDAGNVSALCAVSTDITERKARERQLRTFRKAVDAAGHSIYYTDTDGTIEYVNPAFEETTGYTAAEAIGQTPRLLKSGEHDRDFYEELWDTILAGDTWRGEIVNTTKDDGRYTVEQTIAPVHDEAGEVEHFVAVNADVTERKDRERRYDAIFNQTYQFTGLLDPDGTLVEINEAALAFGETDRAAVVGKKFWNADWFQHGETAATVRGAVERALEGEFVRQTLEVRGGERTAVIDFSIRPVTDERGEITHLVPEGRDITDRVEAKRELERHRDHLAALNHVNAIVQDVTSAVIEQSTRAEIERTVCEALVDEESYDVAWIGDVDRNHQTLTVRTEAGVQGTLDELPLPVDPEDERRSEPTRRAYRTGTIHVRHGIDIDPRRERVDARGDPSVAAIPLVHDETVYGVLTVYAARPNAFGEHEQAVLGQLGEIVGQAITAAERKQALMSDEVVELEFRIPDALESMGIDAPTDGRIVIDDVVPTSDQAHLVYGTSTPDARATLGALTDQHPHWDSVSVLSEEDDWIRFQARVTELPLRTGVASEGGSITEVVMEDGDLDLRIRVPPSGGVTAITETVEGRFSTAQLHAKRQFPRPRDSVTEIRQSLSEKLTARQQAVLQAAYHRGYFEWPRDATGEDLADSLGISPPTFSQHLRMAEKTVVESVLSATTPARESPGDRE